MCKKLALFVQQEEKVIFKNLLFDLNYVVCIQTLDLFSLSNNGLSKQIEIISMNPTFPWRDLNKNKYWAGVAELNAYLVDTKKGGHQTSDRQGCV